MPQLSPEDRPKAIEFIRETVENLQHIQDEIKKKHNNLKEEEEDNI
jgi:hypothetical protein